jgi:hypothetical protein
VKKGILYKELKGEACGTIWEEVVDIGVYVKV